MGFWIWRKASTADQRSLEALRKIVQRGKPRQDAGSTHDEASPSVVSLKQIHPSEGQHRAAEQAQWRWQRITENRRDRIARGTWWISALALVAAGASFWESSRQADFTQGQLDTMRDDQRAWVSLSPHDDGIGIYSALSFANPKFAGVGIARKLRNTGHSPAFHVQWNEKIIYPLYKEALEIEVKKAQSSYCDQFYRLDGSFLDQTLFPGDEISGKVMDGLEQKDVQEALRSRETGPLAHKGFLSLMLIACIDYQINVGTAVKHHQTRYAFFFGAPLIDGAGFMADIQPAGTRPDVGLILFSQSAE